MNVDSKVQDNLLELLTELSISMPESAETISTVITILEQQRERKQFRPPTAPTPRMQKRTREHERNLTLIKQAQCRHPRLIKDSSGARISIRCESCQAKWVPGDTVEFLLRAEKQIGNHTHDGFFEMLQQFESQSPQ
jgi:hypothetical protein